MSSHMRAWKYTNAVALSGFPLTLVLEFVMNKFVQQNKNPEQE